MYSGPRALKGRKLDNLCQLGTVKMTQQVKSTTKAESMSLIPRTDMVEGHGGNDSHSLFSDHYHGVQVHACPHPKYKSL